MGMNPSHAHLVVVVHGIGDMTADDSMLAASLERRVCAMQAVVASFARQDQRPEPIFRCVEWHRQLHAAWYPSVHPAVPQTVYGFQNCVRNALTDAVGDLMMFMAPRPRERLLGNVAAQIRCQYALLRATEVAPGELWNGPISIFAHSLGGAITFETLNANLLHSLPIHAIYTAGSPLPAYLSLHQDGLLTLKNTLLNPANPRFYNLFHPMDPVAYRLEPFLVTKTCPSGFTPPCPPPVVVPREPGLLDNLCHGIARLADAVLDLLWSNSSSTGSERHPAPADQTQVRSQPQSPPTAQAKAFPGPPPTLPSGPAGSASNLTIDDVTSECSIGSSMHSCPSSHDLSDNQDEIQQQHHQHGSFLPLASRRFDFEISDSVLEGPPTLGILLHWSALVSHFSYWENTQVMRFLYNTLFTGL